MKSNPLSRFGGLQHFRLVNVQKAGNSSLRNFGIAAVLTCLLGGVSLSTQAQNNEAGDTR
jgi:hypothetical protein